jgi:putative ABC transport system substrate-binding protein
MIKRRACLGVALAFGAATIFDARAQTQPRTARVALVSVSASLADLIGAEPADTDARAFLHALRDRGYVEGRGFTVERRSAEGRPLERLPALIEELIRLPVDVIVTEGQGASDAARLTSTIPIVAVHDNPIELGLTTSLTRPSRNVTGVTISPDMSINGKRLQLLKEAAPKVSRVAIVDYKYVDGRISPGTHARRREVEAAAPQLGVTPIWAGANSVEEFKQAFDYIVRERADGLLEMGSAVPNAGASVLIEFAARERLPAMYSSPGFAESGGLLAYGPDSSARWIRVADYVDRLLRGAKVADLPWENPTQFDLVVNLKTAKALGLEIPQAMLLRASSVLR